MKIDVKEKSKIAVKRHLKNIENLAEGKETDYSYLNTCWRCGRRFSFWDKITFNITHSFEGNSHRRDCSK